MFHTVVEAKVSQFRCVRNMLQNQFLLLGDKKMFLSEVKNRLLPGCNLAFALKACSPV